MDEATAASQERSNQLTMAGDHQLIVLDVTYPLNWGQIDVDDVYPTIGQQMSHVNIVCAGRNAPDRPVDRAGRRRAKGIES